MLYCPSDAYAAMHAIVYTQKSMTDMPWRHLHTFPTCSSHPATRLVILSRRLLQAPAPQLLARRRPLRPKPVDALHIRANTKEARQLPNFLLLARIVILALPSALTLHAAALRGLTSFCNLRT